jgi:hypothetical protein
LFGSGLSVPHMFFYDQMVFLLPLLVLWSHRDVLGWRGMSVLVLLTAGFYAAPKLMFAWSWMFDVPVLTLAIVALWAFSLLAVREASPKCREPLEGIT